MKRQEWLRKDRKTEKKEIEIKVKAAAKEIKDSDYTD